MGISNFKRIVYSVATESGATVIKFYEAGVTPNFHVAKLEYNARKIYLLCSDNNDWTYSQCYSGMTCKLEYTDFEEFTEILSRQYNIKPLTKSELNGNFSNRTYLNDNDVNYWKPKTLGEGLFNWWD